MKSSQVPKIGTVVRLRSGGPLMTVSRNEDVYGTIGVSWIKATGDAMSMSIPPECVVECNPEAA